MPKKQKEEKWAIPHPGTLEWVICDSFEECMEWFEGFNIPRKLSVESFEKSVERVKEKLLK